MIDLRNETPYGASVFVCEAAGPAQDGEMLTVCVSARFVLPQPSHDALGELRICDDQPAPPLADVHWGTADASSLRYAGQALPYRPVTDVSLNGFACAPGGGRVTRLPVGVSVGRYRKPLLVFGDRRWRRTWRGLRCSEPQPFGRLPLRYEFAFGGTSLVAGATAAANAALQRNPVGIGLYGHARDACDQPLPNVEWPQARIAHWRDRPTPAGLSPVAPHWLPRRAFGGTYDAAWMQRRAPGWPTDFDPQFWSAASEGLALPEPAPGQTVVCWGMCHEGPLAFALPHERLRLQSCDATPAWHACLRLDGLHIDVEPEGGGAVTLYWRHSWRVAALDASRVPCVPMRSVLRSVPA